MTAIRTGIAGSDDTVRIPALDFGWLDGADTGAAGTTLREIAGGVLAVGLILCAIVFLTGVVLWVAARASGGTVGSKNSSFFAGGAGAALLGMVLLGSLVGATGWGADTVSQWVTTVLPIEFGG
jgi:hypothetical protein